MSRLKSVFSVYVAIGLMIFGTTLQTNAQLRRNERDVRDIVRSLSSKVDDFRYSLTFLLRNNSADRQEVTNVENDLKNMQDKIRAFSDNFDRKRENADDIRDIINAAQIVDEYLNNNPQNRKIDNDWSNVRNLLDRLSSNYNVSWDSGNSNLPNDDDDRNSNTNSSTNYPSTRSSNGGNANSFGLTGTYRLDVSQSENAADILGNVSISDDQRDDLQDKLEAPEQIALDVRGNQVSLASSNAPAITLTADGQTRNDNSGGNGRLRASLREQQLTVSRGDGNSDFTMIFSSTDNGKTLKVTRRITTDYLDQTVFADSVYTKTDDVAGLGIENGNSTTDNGVYSSNDQNDRNGSGNYPTTTTPRIGEYIVPNGTMVTGILDNEINTKVSQNNDRFKMTVQAPNEFRGATVEGYISGINRSGKVSGRSQIVFNFERITLRDGKTYDFAGFLQNVTDPNGKVVKIGTEGEAKGDSQTKETVKRGGIGAGIGAVIGAIAGGGKGAVLGAIIGGGAGAGSVIVQGKDDLELKSGSSITVQSSSPLGK